MKTHYIGVQALLVVLSIFWLPCALGKEYIVDEETDGVLLNCAIAFFVMCLLFFIMMIIIAVFVYRRTNGDSSFRKGYDISRRQDKPSKGVSRSNPFYEHSIYSRRSEGSIYLPGREPSYVDKPTKIETIGNEGEYYFIEEKKRDSPPTEKGQQDAMISEKKVNTYDNPAFENPAYESVPENNYEELVA